MQIFILPVQSLDASVWLLSSSFCFLTPIRSTYIAVVPRTPVLKDEKPRWTRLAADENGRVNQSSSSDFRCMLIAIRGSTSRAIIKKTLRISKVKKFIFSRLGGLGGMLKWIVLENLRKTLESGNQFTLEFG